MLTVKCVYSNGEVVYTRINATINEARRYFIGNVFNVGSVSDVMATCTDCVEVES